MTKIKYPVIDGQKECGKCNNILPVSNFEMDGKAYSYRCKKCKKEYNDKWVANNRAKVYEYTKKWNKENKEKRREIEISWRQRNPDIIKECNRKSGAKWSKKNKALRTAISCRRIYAKKKRTPSWADLEKIKWFYLEAERLTKETGIPHEVDHIIPLQGKTVSGLHVHNNLQVLTMSENRKKCNKLPDNFF